MTVLKKEPMDALCDIKEKLISYNMTADKRKWKK